MAESGPIPDFNKSAEKFAELIENYKNAVNNGDILSPSPESFAAYCGTTQQALFELVKRAKDRESLYYSRAKAYVLLLTWLRAEVAGGQHWPPKSDYMRKFLLLQDWGDGFVYQEKQDPKKQNGKRFTISFGGNDKRSRSAWD